MSKLYFNSIDEPNTDHPWPRRKFSLPAVEEKHRNAYRHLGGFDLLPTLAAIEIVSAATLPGGTDQEKLSASTVAASTTDVGVSPTLSSITASGPTHEISPECKAARNTREPFTCPDEGCISNHPPPSTNSLRKRPTTLSTTWTTPNWDTAALTKAKSFVKTMSMSPEAVRDQLTSDAEGFDPRGGRSYRPAPQRLDPFHMTMLVQRMNTGQL